MTFWPVSVDRARRCAAVLAFVCPAVLSAQARRNGVLLGRVLAGDVAVPSAAILVSGGRVTLARVDGRYQISLPAGRYAVRIRRVGYSIARDSVTIRDGQTTVLNVRLEREPSPLETVASLGTRGRERAAIDAPVAVNVIEGVDLRATGRTGTAGALAAIAPSITQSHETVAQGSDLVHAISMRGLDPDHVLVLVNGHRRHGSALVDLNRSSGRGSSGIDLNAIPASLIERVEILHGEAVAQYGADAIAGVVNIVLKSGVHGVAATTLGERSSSFDGEAPAGAAGGPARTATDGRVLQASIDKGVVFGARGFLHGGVELRDRGATDRAVRGYRASPAPPMDHYGDAHTHDVALLLNGGNLFANDVDLYGNVGGARRTVGALAAYTFGVTPAQNTDPKTVGNGAGLPLIGATIWDYAGTLGVRGRVDEWQWDLGTVYGRNTVDLSLSPAYNPDLNVALARLDAGSQRLGQSTTNLELTRAFDNFEETRLTLGGEFRHDDYQVVAGEPAGYTPSSVSSSWAGLPVFTPANASSASRHALAGYADLETDLTRTLMLALAGRVERYSDVGTQHAGKMSVRYEPLRNIVLRGSLGRGYHAPSLQQTSFTTTYLDPFVGPLTLVPPTDRGAARAGARPLGAERSTDYQASLAIELSTSLSFTLDAYRTDLADRVLLEDVFLDTGGSTPGHAFQNVAATRTDGLDATLSYATRFEDGATLRLASSANVNHTSLTGLTQRAGCSLCLNGLTPSSLSGAEQLRLTRGQPRDNFLLSAQFALHDFGALLRTQRFGEVASGDFAPASASGQTFGPRWVTDVNASYTLLRKYTLTAGADNLFDVYPQRASLPGSAQQPSGTLTAYPGASPFGFNGRFVYGRLSIYL